MKTKQLHPNTKNNTNSEVVGYHASLEALTNINGISTEDHEDIYALRHSLVSKVLAIKTDEAELQKKHISPIAEKFQIGTIQAILDLGVAYEKDVHHNLTANAEEKVVPILNEDEYTNIVEWQKKNNALFNSDSGIAIKRTYFNSDFFKALKDIDSKTLTGIKNVFHEMHKPTTEKAEVPLVETEDFTSEEALLPTA